MKTPLAGIEEPALAETIAAYDRCALLLQGGGALGAYHVGVWQALWEAGIEPSWIAGVSIGAIHAAIIAGNPREKRLERLEAFWDEVTRFDPLAGFDVFGLARPLQSRIGALTAMIAGQPGFFRPRFPNPWLLPPGAPGATSFYDTADLKGTLEKLVDFDRLNDGPMRIAVGAVDVESGNFVWFDNRDPKTPTRIDARHVMASGALPPALPAVEIDGRHYWDGGIVSNTPLEHLLDQNEDQSSLVFQVDLFPAQGALPTGVGEVLARHKDIVYSSRTRAGTTRYAQTFALRRRLLDALGRVPEELRTAEDRAIIEDLCRPGVLNILHLIYRSRRWEGESKDYEFSRRAAADHRVAGYADMAATLAHRDWLAVPTDPSGVAIHDLHDSRRR